MILIWASLGLLFIVCFYLLRFHVSSVLIYLSAGFEKRTKGVEVLHSLRQNLVHERKKKIAGLEMILSSWERGEEVQPRYEYYRELVEQLKELVQNERRNLMAVTTDVFLWARLWRLLIRIDKMSRAKGERSNVVGLRRDLAKFRELLDEIVEDATERFSFSLNDAVRESLKTVRIEKSGSSDIKIEESLDNVGDTIRFSYSKFKEWQRLLTNLIRNAVEAVEAKQRAEGIAEGFSLRGEEEPVAAGFSLRGGEESLRVRISTKESKKESGRAGVPDLREDEFSESRRQGSPASGGICQRHDQPCTEVEVVIEDSGVGMDEATRSSFFKKGFTSGKEHGLGLGVTEECVEMIGKYGGWEIESRKSVGTRITISIDQDRARKAELILPEAKSLSGNKVALTLSAAVFVLIAIVVLLSYAPRDRNPANVRLVGENRVVAENKKGIFLWDQTFHQRVQKLCLDVADIDGDGKREVLVGTEGGFKETGYVYCFSSGGKELWKCALGGKNVFGESSDRYSAIRTLVQDLNLDGEMEIVVQAGNNPGFPSQTALLSREGRIQSSYWHTGIVGLLACQDINNDDTAEVILGGINNRLDYSAVLIVLDYKMIYGQSPPYREKALPKAQEKVYVKFPFVKELGGENSLFSQVTTIKYIGKEEGVDVYWVDVLDYRDFKREYYLDETFMHVKRIVINPISRNIWQNLKKEGFVDYDITPEVVESWKQIEVWKDGVKVK
jgi:signal transduction histidine kinase